MLWVAHFVAKAPYIMRGQSTLNPYLLTPEVEHTAWRYLSRALNESEWWICMLLEREMSFLLLDIFFRSLCSSSRYLGFVVAVDGKNGGCGTTVLCCKRPR